MTYQKNSEIFRHWLVDYLYNGLYEFCKKQITCDNCPFEGFDNVCKFINPVLRKTIPISKLKLIVDCFNDKIINVLIEKRKEDE